MKLDNVIAVRPTKTVYRDGDVSIKVFDDSYFASDILNEALNQAIVHESGFSVPAVVDVTRVDGRWAIVSEFITGVTLARYVEENPEKEDEYYNRFVDIQLEMHRYAAEKLRHHTDKMHGKISKSGLDATTRYELHTKLNSLPKHSKLCHGDFTLSNVIITPANKAYVIDWSHATQGNASADSARTYLHHMLTGRERLAEKYLDLFCKKSDTAKQYVQKWLAIVAASWLVKGNPEEREFLLRWTNVVEYE